MNINNFKYTKEFINHNLKNFKKNNYITENKILVEVFNFKPSIIPISYLSNALAEKYKANIIGYHPIFPNIKQKIKKFYSENLNPFGLDKIYRSFGVNNFITPTKSSSKAQELIFKKIYKDIKSKKDILGIKIDGILLGDLIYDEFLRSNNIITINFKTKDFKEFLKVSISFIFYGKKNLKRKNSKV